MNKNLNIIVVCGGISSEREVSLRSGSAVYEALKEYGYRNTGIFDFTGDNISELLALKPDVAYLALHGVGGEDGCIQGALQLAGIAYTGPGVAASALCMNKIFTKQVLASAGLPTAAYTEVRKSDYDKKELADILEEKIGYPMVLKSPCQGFSIGVVIVHERSDLEPAIDEIFHYGDQLMAEEFLSGTEITLPIIGNEELIVLPEIEITSENEFYDYQAKYTNGMCHHIIPARISDDDRKKVIEIGKKAYRELNCCGVSRIDFIIDKVKGPMIIEVNTIPGMTSMSLVPDAGRAAGISFGELVSRIIEYGLKTKR